MNGSEMTRRRESLGAMLVVCGVLAWSACSDDEAGGDVSPGDAIETLDAPDGVAPDTLAPDGVEPETVEPETSEPDTTNPEVIADTTVDTIPDADPHTPIVAVAGQRCDLSERVGLVQLESTGGEPASHWISAVLEDAPSPWYGEPALSDASCAFHRFVPEGACPPCDADELCAIDGTCVHAPARLLDAALTVTSDGSDETFVADPVTGDLWGSVTLGGPTFALAIRFGEHTITVPAAAIPTTLDALDGMLEGSYEAPTRLDLTWAPAPAGTHVFTHIPINHHAAGPTFTECTTPATTGSLSVAEAMLAPLAIITGLEFQGLEHVRFFAAETPLGCVEVRYLTRHWVNL